MIKFMREKSLKVSAAVITSVMLASTDAHANPGGGAGTTDFSTITDNINSSIAGLPGLLAGVSYMIGILLGVLGILKIKDHVEQPTSVKLQEGAIRLVAGGGLFALPIVFEAMQGTIGDGAGPSAIEIDSVTQSFTLNE